MPKIALLNYMAFSCQQIRHGGTDDGASNLLQNPSYFLAFFIIHFYIFQVCFSLFKSLWYLIHCIPSTIVKIARITPTGLMSVQSQLIWLLSKVKATAKSPHIIVVDINRFLFFIFLVFKWDAKFVCSICLSRLRKVEKRLKKGWFYCTKLVPLKFYGFLYFLNCLRESISRVL